MRFAVHRGMEYFSQADAVDFKAQNEQEPAHFLSSLIKDEKLDERVLEWAGFLALENKQWQIAENVFSVLLERRDKTLDFLGLAKSLRKQLRLEEAEECYLTALDKITEPCNLLFIVYKALGEIYLLKDDFSMAEEYYNKASTLNPSCLSLVFHRAMIHLKERNYEESERDFQTFIHSYPVSEKAWLGLALARKALGDAELALASLNRVLDINPENQKALQLKKQWCPSVSEIFSDSFCFSA